MDLDGFFSQDEDDDEFTGKRTSLRRIRKAEKKLGVTLPAAYVELLLRQNGGVPVR